MKSLRGRLCQEMQARKLKGVLWGDPDIPSRPQQFHTRIGYRWMNVVRSSGRWDRDAVCICTPAMQFIGEDAAMLLHKTLAAQLLLFHFTAV